MQADLQNEVIPKPMTAQRGRNYGVSSGDESDNRQGYESAYPPRSHNFKYPSSTAYQQQQYIYHQNNVTSSQNDYSNNNDQSDYNNNY